MSPPRERRSPRATRAVRSLAGSHAFRDFVLDQLAELGDVRARSMFGGTGLYCNDLFFGLIARDRLYLKVDDGNRPEYVRAGMKPFKPYPDRPSTMQYYEVPVGVLESAFDLLAWSRKAVDVARRSSVRTK
jgi:DNA transformation protein